MLISCYYVYYRYGFDSELFSFESGRRCPTGPGIYAFKCKRAEALFNLLQEYIQRAGQEEHVQREAHGYGFRPDGIPSSPEARYNQPHQSNGAAMAFIDPAARGIINNAVPSPTLSGNYYINNMSHEYVNTTPQCLDSPVQPTGDVSSHTLGLPEEPKINYAVLDLQSSSTLAPENMAHTATGLSSRNSVVEVVDVDSNQVFVNLPVYGNGSGETLLERRESSRRSKAESLAEGVPAYANLDLGNKTTKILFDSHSQHSRESTPTSPMVSHSALQTPLHTPSHTSISVTITPTHLQISALTPSSPSSQTSNPNSPFSTHRTATLQSTSIALRHC